MWQTIITYNTYYIVSSYVLYNGDVQQPETLSKESDPNHCLKALYNKEWGGLNKFKIYKIF